MLALLMSTGALPLTASPGFTPALVKKFTRNVSPLATNSDDYWGEQRGVLICYNTIGTASHFLPECSFLLCTVYCRFLKCVGISDAINSISARNKGNLALWAIKIRSAGSCQFSFLPFSPVV